MIKRDDMAALQDEDARLIALLDARGIEWRLLPEPIPPGFASPISELEPSRLSTAEKDSAVSPAVSWPHRLRATGNAHPLDVPFIDEEDRRECAQNAPVQRTFSAQIDSGSKVQQGPHRCSAAGDAPAASRSHAAGADRIEWQGLDGELAQKTGRSGIWPRAGPRGGGLACKAGG